MKAITIHQPWAWAIIDGRKRFENRTWPTHFRGRVAIHAGASKASMKLLHAPHWGPLLAGMPEDAPFGAIVGTVEIVDCVRPKDAGGGDDPFAEGPWCWVLANPKRLARPIACKGSLSFWTTNLVAA